MDQLPILDAQQILKAQGGCTPKNGHKKDRRSPRRAKKDPSAGRVESTREGHWGLSNGKNLKNFQKTKMRILKNREQLLKI